MALTPDARPALWRLARLSFDPVRDQPVLLYPEGAMLLNRTGAAILELCDGRRTLADIAGELGARYGGANLLGDVTDYLNMLEAREMVRDAR